MAQSNTTPYRVPTTLEEVRKYVTDTSNGSGPTNGIITIQMTHSNMKKTSFAELRLQLNMTVDDLKSKLYTHCGTAPSSMQVLLRQGYMGPVLRELNDNNATLTDYDIRVGHTLHVIDTDPNSLSAHGALENIDTVTRYVMSDEDYKKRPNTYLKFREQQRKSNPNWSAIKGNTIPQIDIDEDNRPDIAVGNRVEVFPGGRRAEVMFVGKQLDGMPSGWWIGVRFDEPVGKNDGSVNGKRYFEACKGFGGMVRPSKVKVGDFPPLDDDNFDDEL